MNSARSWRGCRNMRKRGSTSASRMRRLVLLNRRSRNSILALSIAPGHSAAHYNRGLALHDLGRYSAALGSLERVLASAPEHVGAWLSHGRSLAALNRLGEAALSYSKAGAIRKDDPDVHFSEALALLALGDYRRGFEKYEARWRRSGMPAQQSRGRPLWLGEYPLAHKTVLLHAEQGFGDTIQFARYVRLLAGPVPRLCSKCRAN